MTKSTDRKLNMDAYLQLLLLKWVGTGRHDLSHPFTSHLTVEALLMI